MEEVEPVMAAKNKFEYRETLLRKNFCSDSVCQDVKARNSNLYFPIDEFPTTRIFLFQTLKEEMKPLVLGNFEFQYRENLIVIPPLISVTHRRGHILPCKLRSRIPKDT